MIIVARTTNKSSRNASRQPKAIIGTVDTDVRIDRISAEAEALFGRPVADVLGQPLANVVTEADCASCLAALIEASETHECVTLALEVAAPGSDALGLLDSVGCEVLLLPLLPAPSCAFVFLPTAGPPPPNPISSDLPATLTRFGLGSEIAQLVHGVTADLTDSELPGLDELTNRELQVVTLLLGGDRPPAIAMTLFVTQSTIRNHLAAIYSKMGVSSQQELMNLFRSARLSPPKS
jgi:DNA-binding CsgD family transcriptional regulator